MPLLTDTFYKKTNQQKTKCYIETGTYLGNGIKEVINDYDVIHSIELSEKWYQYNVEQFKENPKVKMHFGDSKKILPQLLNTINEPVTIYLDAHYSGIYTAYGEEETPLLHELEIMKNRSYNDIIIIDDCRLLGKKGICGVENDKVYPEMIYDWRNITIEKIFKLSKPNCEMLINFNYEYTTGCQDQIIITNGTII